jgi:transposase
VDLVFPELVQEVRKLTIRSIRRLLAEYPTAREIAGLELEELEDRLGRWSQRRLRPDKIARIHRLARESIGVVEGLETARMEMRQLLESLELVEQRLQEVEAAQRAALEKVPYAELLLTVPQLGSVTVATILGETGDLRHYKNAEMVIKMAGYNLYTISSGMFRGKTRITKRGRPLLRRYLFIAACRLSKKGAPLREFHERLTARKAKPQVLVGSCRKLLRLLVAMVRDGKPYEPGRLAMRFGEAA